MRKCKCLLILWLFHLLYSVVSFNVVRINSSKRPRGLILYEKITNRDKQLNRMFDAMQQARIQTPADTLLINDPLLPKVESIAKTAELKKASSVRALRVGHLTAENQFMVIIEGTNNRQIQAIADSIEDDHIEQYKNKPYIKDGTIASGWIILDYGPIMVHVMTSAMREFYKLEQRWAQGEVVDLSSILTQHATADGMQNAVDMGSMIAEASVEDDDIAFWGGEERALEERENFSADSVRHLSEKVGTTMAQGVVLRKATQRLKPENSALANIVSDLGRSEVCSRMHTVPAVARTTSRAAPSGGDLAPVRPMGRVGISRRRNSAPPSTKVPGIQDSSILDEFYNEDISATV